MSTGDTGEGHSIRNAERWGGKKKKKERGGVGVKRKQYTMVNKG